MRLRPLIFLLLGLLAFHPASAESQQRFVLGTTTTLESSGFLEWLLPRFTEKSGIRVQVIVQGTGQVHASARRGDVDAILTHDPEGERQLVQDNVIVRYRQVMRNHFILVGPRADTASVEQADGVDEAFRRIADERALFVSRGDDSGTHRAEVRVWERVRDAPPSPATEHWYRSAGAGMGATLNVAAALNAYTLVDEGTWQAFGNKRRLVVLKRDPEQLGNIYGVAMVNPDEYPNVQFRPARKFVTWLSGEEGRQLLSRFEIDGQRIFEPVSAKRDGRDAPE